MISYFVVIFWLDGDSLNQSGYSAGSMYPNQLPGRGAAAHACEWIPGDAV